MIDWYLLKPPYDQLSGFEGEALEDWGQTGFEEVLDSEAADEVEIYNYDLSVCKVCKVMVQNNHQDQFRSSFIAICSQNIPLNCWKILKLFMPQRGLAIRRA